MAGFRHRLSKLKPRASETMGGFGENEGPYHELRRPFFLVFTDILRENTTSADIKTFFWFLPISGKKKKGNS